MHLKPVVLIIDDELHVRESVRLLVESAGLAARAYASASAFLDECDPDQPGCLVTDLRMPGIGGLELHAQLAERGIELPVIVITGYGDVPTAVQAMKAGATDFVQKPFRPQALLERIQEAVQRDATARRERKRRNEITARLARLTPRQREVLGLVLAGKSNRIIAEELGVSAKAIEAHRARIMDTMKAANVVELAQLAFLSGRFHGVPVKSDGDLRNPPATYEVTSGTPETGSDSPSNT